MSRFDFLYFEFGPDRYQPDKIQDPDHVYEDSQQKVSFMVGFLAMALPVILWLNGTLTGNFHDAVSHFYYTKHFYGDVFVGILCAVGTIMIAYRSNNWKVDRLASIGGLLALLVAFFPADGWVSYKSAVNVCPGAIDPPATPAPNETGLDLIANHVHGFAALALFSLLAYFCLQVFTRIKPGDRCEDGSVLQKKSLRNRIYKIAGWTIIGSIMALLVGFSGYFPRWNCYDLTFYLEALALLAFGLSWTVKGRFFVGLLENESNPLRS